MVVPSTYIKYGYIVMACIAITILSCEKQEVNFGSGSLTDDPNIITIDTISINASTFRLDSFSTLNKGYFLVGQHYDSSFGLFQSTAYFDLSVPYDSSGMLQLCTSCYFDSMVAVTQFSGGYYGDTSRSFVVNMNQLTQLIDDGTSFGYTATKRNYNETPVGSFSGTISPSRQDIIRIRMNDDMGKDLYNKIQRNSDTITNSDLFLNYVKGFCFTGNDFNNNTAYYLKATGDSDFVLLYYHKNAPLPVNYVVKFPLNAAHQFNGFVTDYSGTNLTAFNSQKQQSLTSTQTNGYVYLRYNNGLYPRFNFPSLYSLKELAPYINVVNAELEIYPLQNSYGRQSYYQLPPELNMYIVNEYGETLSNIYYPGTTTAQTGDLNIDYLYRENTKYTYNLTSYISSILAQGGATSYDLILQPASGDSTEQRLVLKALNNNSFKLKLHVLGL